MKDMLVNNKKNVQGLKNWLLKICMVIIIEIKIVTKMTIKIINSMQRLKIY